ncbi:MAG: hypothetical protein M0R21_07730 [Lentimicrobiaceae bacterium]|jgi:hypothetical protein|nr:hypothetical protein [Lentimicrobiaceae bacterium]
MVTETQEDKFTTWVKNAETFSQCHFCKHPEYNAMLKKKKRGDYLGAIIVNIIILYVINALPRWEPGFITGGYTAALWIMNINFAVRVLGNFFLLLYSERWFRNLANTIFHLMGFIMLISLYVMYPFVFNTISIHWLDKMIKIIIFISIFVTGIQTIVYSLKLILGKKTDVKEY